MLSSGDSRPKRLAATVGAFSLLSILPILCGCIVGPNYARPQSNLNNEWAERDDKRVSTQAAACEQWWKTFKDPALDQLVQLARRQNLPLQIAGLRILEARAQLGIAVGQQYPQTQELAGSAAAVGLSENAANSAFIEHHFRDYQVGFDAAWELDFWGKYRRGTQSEAANLIATMADYDDALVSLTAEVARTYAVMRTYEVLIELTRENVTMEEEGLQIAESRLRNGVTTELDVTQARALLESTKATIPQLQISLGRAQNALGTLLGQPAGEVQGLLGGPKVIPTAPSDVAVGMPAELLRRRPDIRSAELAAVAQSARIGMTKADLYPSFSLVGTIGLESSDNKYANSRNLFDSGSVFYTFGPAVSWPILNYGRIKNNVRVQDARFQQSLVQYQDTVLKAAQEVEDALTGFLRAQESAVFGQNSVEASKRSVEIALTQYREGAVDYQRVLDTQRFLLSEENKLARTRSSVATDLIALYKALGGGWELREGQPIVAESIQAEMQKRTDWGRLLSPPAPENLMPPPTAGDMPYLPSPSW